MLDQSFFKTNNPASCDVRLYTPNTAVTTQGFQVWQKPMNVSVVAMWVVSGGGGGGGGFTRSGSISGSGAGGGASSNIAKLMIPAIFLPDNLYVSVGSGGQGGAASGNGGAGINSYVLLNPTTAVLPNLVCYSGVNAPGGGGSGTGGAAGVGGTVPTVAVVQPFNNYGLQFATSVGLVGGTGGTDVTVSGSNITCWVQTGTTANMFSPGAGGAGCVKADLDGGSQTPAAAADFGCNTFYYPQITGSCAAGGSTTGSVGITGGSGIKRMTPLFNCGGAGGGSSNAGTGGNGGAGGYGSGGGGGGAGTTGGRGGNGGPGFVLIISW